MKKWLCLLAVLLLPALLCTAAQAAEMARIEITTVNQAENALDFVTKPVAGHVSSQIVTWTPGYVIPPEPWYEPCLVSVYDEAGQRQIDRAEAEVKVRGNWTTSYQKKPLRIRFAEAQSMLALNDGAAMKNWVLLAEYKDGSMLRNKAALAIAEGLLAPDGLYAADAGLVEVTVNGEYMGVYLLSEHQQVNPDRVNITRPEPEYQGTDIGYFLEFDSYSVNEGELNRFTVGYANHAPLIPYDGRDGSGRKQAGTTDGFTIKSDIYSAKQRNFIADYVDNVYRILYHAAYRDEAYVFNDACTRIKRTKEITPREAVERAVNVDSLADMYLLNEVVCDADVYLTSFFMRADFGEGGDRRLTFEAPWDFDSSMGNKNRCAEAQGFYAANILLDVNDEFTSINPWLAVLMYEDWFQELIAQKWTAAYDSGVFTRVLEMISRDAVQYSDAFARNYEKWDNLVNDEEFGHELSWRAARCSTQQEAADHLRWWLERRVEFLNAHWHVSGRAEAAQE